MKSKNAAIITGALVLACAASWVYVAGLPQQEVLPQRELSYQQGLGYGQGVKRLASLVQRISWSKQYTMRVEQVELGAERDLKAMLPDIGQYPMVIDPRLGPNEIGVEIFVTTRLAGKDSDGLQVQIADAFNQSGQRLRDGRGAKVRVRKIESGTAHEFIASRKYLPDAFNPVHRLWIEMAKASGVEMTPIREGTVRDVAGVVMKTDTYESLEQRHGSVDVKSIIEEVAHGDLAMGYTNPFASSTGLDFLVTILSTYAGGDESAMLSPAVVSAFEQFQRGIPFVALTTLHMRDSVRNEGSLDAFILGYQTFLNTAELQDGYEFVPFGIPHEHPLYAVGEVSPEKLEVLELFARFAEQDRFRKLAFEYGFNQNLGFNHTVAVPSGEMLLSAQRLWKEKKDAGVSISAVFVCDVSTSMKGSRIRALQESLIRGSELITPENSIGLVLFSDTVTTALPIKEFKLEHKGVFHAAVRDMRLSNGTAMYDGIVAGLQMLVEEKQIRPDAKLMMFVLTDGATNRGLSYEAILPVIKALDIPIFTIGYEAGANLEALKLLASIVEAASINTSEGEVGYTIGSLLNAQM